MINLQQQNSQKEMEHTLTQLTTHNKQLMQQLRDEKSNVRDLQSALQNASTPTDEMLQASLKKAVEREDYATTMELALILHTRKLESYA